MFLFWHYLGLTNYIFELLRYAGHCLYSKEIHLVSFIEIVYQKIVSSNNSEATENNNILYLTFSLLYYYYSCTVEFEQRSEIEIEKK